MQVGELVKTLQQFPQGAEIQIEHYVSDHGFLSWNLFDFVSVEGNESDDPAHNQNVIMWIRPKPKSRPG